MKFTQSQAGMKWCPFARSHLSRKDEVISSINRQGPGEPEHWCMCIADRCMAWRWAPWEYGVGPTHGWCGLAGEPHDEDHHAEQLRQVREAAILPAARRKRKRKR